MRLPPVHKLGLILEPRERNVFERKAVLNTGVYQEGKTVHMFYRAVDELHRSTIGYARLDGPTKVVERWDAPYLKRTRTHESAGVEDPRVTKIGRRLYMTYVAYDGNNAITAYADGTNILKLKKRGIISPAVTHDEMDKLLRAQPLKDSYRAYEAYGKELSGAGALLWAKDMFFFPRKIHGRYAALVRILPDIQLVYFDSFKQLQSKVFWTEFLKSLADRVVLDNRYTHESSHIGGGAPPIEVPEGWLVLYHAVEKRLHGRVYHAGAALLDRDDPARVIGRLDRPLFSPAKAWEVKGDVDNVVFPTGTAQFGDDIYIYYGAADSVIAVVRVALRPLVRALMRSDGTS